MDGNFILNPDRTIALTATGCGYLQEQKAEPAFIGWCLHSYPEDQGWLEADPPGQQRAAGSENRLCPGQKTLVRSSRCRQFIAVDNP